MSDMKVDYVDHMGTDLSVVNAARVSMHKKSAWANSVKGHVDFEKPNSLSLADSNLIRYLAKHKHWTPFAHTAISVRVKAPIFVARQLGKHQVGLVWNEVSRRYVSDPPEFYTPKVWREKAENVKQGSSDRDEVELLGFRGFNRQDIRDAYQGILDHSLDLYNEMLDMDVCPEQARMVLPQSMMTEWIWTGNLVSFANMCKLRLDPHTQKETREVAAMIQDVIAPLYPVSWEALKNV